MHCAAKKSTTKVINKTSRNIQKNFGVYSQMKLPIGKDFCFFVSWKIVINSVA